MEYAGAHNDLEREGVAVKWDVFGVVGLVDGQIADGGDFALLEVDAQGRAGAFVGESARAGQAKGAVVEGGVGVGGGAVARERVVGAFADGAAFARVGCAEDLEGFEEGWEGDLELVVCFFVLVGGRLGGGFCGRGGRGEGVGREEGFIEECEAWVFSGDLALRWGGGIGYLVTRESRRR